jgi:Cu+-exporting ATPase
MAASIENHSEHPLASAIVDEAKQRALNLLPVYQFRSTTGKGVQGTVSGRTIQIGGERLFKELFDVSQDIYQGTLEMAQSFGSESTVLFVIIDGRDSALIAIGDAIKSSAQNTIKKLRDQGTNIVMMTGDNHVTADAVAKQLGIDQFFAEVMPEDKAARIKELQSQGKIVAMAGDGVNDAPALAQADVGIAFASGTDVAIESADITLLKPDLNGILKARNLSRATMKNIRQNLFFAFIYNVIGVPIAAGVLFPFIGVLLSPMIASAAMTFSSVSVILNALRLRKVDLE